MSSGFATAISRWRGPVPPEEPNASDQSAPQHRQSKQTFSSLRGGERGVQNATPGLLWSGFSGRDPKAIELQLCTRLGLTALLPTHHLGRSLKHRLPWQHDWLHPREQRGAEYLQRTSADGFEVSKGCWLQIRFLIRTAAFKKAVSCDTNLFVLQSASWHRRHRELGTRREAVIKLNQMWKKPHKDNSEKA